MPQISVCVCVCTHLHKHEAGHYAAGDKQLKEEDGEYLPDETCRQMKQIKNFNTLVTYLMAT